jgi:hypothetical protein
LSLSPSFPSLSRSAILPIQCMCSIGVQMPKPEELSPTLDKWVIKLHTKGDRPAPPPRRPPPPTTQRRAPEQQVRADSATMNTPTQHMLLDMLGPASLPRLISSRHCVTSSSHHRAHGACIHLGHAWGCSSRDVAPPPQVRCDVFVLVE